MEHYSYLIYEPYRRLLLGLVLLFLAVIWTCTGKALAPYYGWVYRAKDSTSFWFNVAVYSLVGTVFIGDFIYKVR